MRDMVRYPLAALGVATWLIAAAAQAGAGELDDLKAQVQQLMNRIEALEMQKAIAVEPAAGAPERTVSSGNDNVKLAISGQVNRAVLYADDGDRSKFFQVDNDNSSTRVRWVGEGRLNEDFSVGALVEVQFESNSTADIDIDQESGASTNNFTERHLTLYLDSKRLGRLWLGQGDTASNGTSEVDLSGTTVVGYAGTADLAGGLSFKNSGTRDLASRSGDDPMFFYGKLGYLFQPFSIGKTALAVDYGMTDDLAAVGDEFATWGVFAVQNIDRVSTELYVGLRSHQLDRTGVSVDDIAGARVKF